MKKVIPFLLMFSMFLGHAQSETKFHKITLEDKRNSPIGLNFTVEKVYDGRQFKENIGTVQKGIFNKKVLANFENPLDVEIGSYLKVILPETEKKIDIRISELYVSELTKAFSEVGYATIVADIVEKIDGTEYIVGTYSYMSEGNGTDVTSEHDTRLKVALIQILTEYKNTSADKKTKIAFDPNQISSDRKLVAMPRKGVYLTYADVLNDKPFTEEVNFSNKNERYFIQGPDGKDKSYYFGFSDGANFYINVAKYSGNFYSKSEVIGNKYFIEDIVYDANNVLASGAMFGLIGVLLSSSSGGNVPMMIDCSSGQPIFLSNAEIKVMLKPYPELFEEYKNGKKRNEDVKEIMRKYYQLTMK